MLRNTTGRLYSVAGAGALIAVAHITLALLGPVDSHYSDRTIKLIGAQFDSSELTAPMPSAWAAGPCRGCDLCGQGREYEHLLYPFGIRSNAKGAKDHVNECWLSNGSCDRWHPIGCNPILAEAATDLTTLWQRLAVGMPASDVAKAIREWPDVIELNSVREAIQVVGCDGQIIAHLPIAGDDTRTLEALLE